MPAASICRRGPARLGSGMVRILTPRHEMQRTSDAVRRLAGRLPSSTQRGRATSSWPSSPTWVVGEVGPVRLPRTGQAAGLGRRCGAAETADLGFFAKQNCQLQSFEAALVAVALRAGAGPASSPSPATDLTGACCSPRTRDRSGPSTAEEDLEAWGTGGRRGAQLQRELEPHVDLLSAAGLTDARPRRTPRRTSTRATGRPGRPCPDDRPAVRCTADRGGAPSTALPSHVAGLGQTGSRPWACRSTLNHGDLHGRNVFPIGRELRFFDFADSLLTEPLAALLIPLNVLSGAARRRPRRPPALAARGCRPRGVERPGADGRPCGPPSPPPSSWGGSPAPRAGPVLCVDGRAELAEWGGSVPGWMETRSSTRRWDERSGGAGRT